MVKSRVMDDAYEELNAFFTTNERSVVEIAIIPSALQPEDTLTLQDGINLGVSKKILTQAFLKARQSFFATNHDPDLEDLCLESTRIILLFDPEHLTAANFRKRRIDKIKQAYSEENRKPIAVALQREVDFLDSILTSPLHRQTKSPTLWHHRSYIISHLRLHRDLADDFDFTGSVIQTELGCVFKASERHPKNYYAWRHARTMLTVIIHELRRENTDDEGNTWVYHLQRMLESATTYTEKWCLKNPSDTSGWSFLAFLLQHLRSLDWKYDLITKILSVALRWGWQYESVWAFFRMMLADPDILGDKAQVLLTVVQRSPCGEGSKKKMGSIDETDTETPCMKAIKWIDRYSAPTNT
ncbi:protein prenylyltransferase [Lophium mytilinum]|uniref:Protein prenylyltransferase n=1 Tax=Lophium mytilinum TaxID=390894 RepID=A0A6A6QIH1_9PEZI|nr:protein prenylyltransferase [Lophium mytilinum]